MRIRLSKILSLRKPVGKNNLGTFKERSGRVWRDNGYLKVSYESWWKMLPDCGFEFFWFRPTGRCIFMNAFYLWLPIHGPCYHDKLVIPSIFCICIPQWILTISPGTYQLVLYISFVNHRLFSLSLILIQSKSFSNSNGTKNRTTADLSVKSLKYFINELKILFLAVYQESVMCSRGIFCMSDYFPVKSLFWVTWVYNMTCWA